MTIQRTTVRILVPLVLLCCISGVVGEYQRESDDAVQDLPLRDAKQGDRKQGLHKESMGRLGRRFTAMIEDRDMWREEWGSKTPLSSEWDEGRKLEAAKLKLRKEEGGKDEVKLREAEEEEEMQTRKATDAEKRRGDREREQAEDARRLAEEMETKERMKEEEERVKQEEEVMKMMEEAEKVKEEEQKRKEAEQKAERQREEEQEAERQREEEQEAARKREEEQEAARKREEEQEAARKEEEETKRKIQEERDRKEEELRRQKEEDRRHEEEEKQRREKEEEKMRRKASQKAELPLRQEGGQEQEERVNFLDLRSSEEDEEDENQGLGEEGKYGGAQERKVDLPLRGEETPPLRGDEETPAKETVCEVKEQKGVTAEERKGGLGLREPSEGVEERILEKVRSEGARSEGAGGKEENGEAEQAVEDMLKGDRSQKGQLRVHKRTGVSQFACFQASSLVGYLAYHLVFHRAHASLTPVVPSRGLLTPAALTLSWSLSSALQYYLHTAVVHRSGVSGPPRFSLKASLLISAIGTVTAPGIARLWVLAGLEGTYCFLATAVTWASYYNLLWLA